MLLLIDSPCARIETINNGNKAWDLVEIDLYVGLHRFCYSFNNTIIITSNNQQIVYKHYFGLFICENIYVIANSSNIMLLL